MMTPEQVEYQKAMKKMQKLQRKVKSDHIKQPKSCCGFRMAVFNFVNGDLNPAFDNFIMGCIIANVICLAMPFYHQPAG